jgi:predicted  nucleic acid-binding Zn-ribbon protein
LETCCQGRASKAEEEVADLVKKSQQLEVELDKTREELKEKEQALTAAKLEVNSLNQENRTIVFVEKRFNAEALCHLISK